LDHEGGTEEGEGDPYVTSHQQMAGGGGPHEVVWTGRCLVACTFHTRFRPTSCWGLGRRSWGQ
jgi:hypothetical protein